MQEHGSSDNWGSSEELCRYLFEDFPFQPDQHKGWGPDCPLGGYLCKVDSDPKVYAVQTTPAVITRCMLMTTDPGDLVFDPTCGSGTTAYVAEQWGRRWITCDTSRVALTLAKQRLMTASFDYYELAHPAEGVGSGLKYKTVPHITLGSIANNPDIREGMTRSRDRRGHRAARAAGDAVRPTGRGPPKAARQRPVQRRGRAGADGSAVGGVFSWGGGWRGSPHPGPLPGGEGG